MHPAGTNEARRGTSVGNADTNMPNSRRWLEAAGWIVIVSVLWGADLMAKIAERDQTGIGKEDFRLISEQVTSGIAVLIMIVFVVYWVRLFPLRRDAWVPAIIGHTVGSIIFAFGHQSLMIAMRIPWYAMNDKSYVWREPFVNNLFVEYQKDIKVYLGILLIIGTYQLYMRTLSRGLVSAEADRGPSNDRLVVQTGSGRAVLTFDQIDYLEAARNYVSVYVEDREYIVRDTMTNLMKSLAGGPFTRSHRSYVVNVDKIDEIRSVDGKQSVLLKGGQSVPLSRSYCEAFEAAIAGASASGHHSD
jgi:hypothetical protein